MDRTRLNNRPAKTSAAPAQPKDAVAFPIDRPTAVSAAFTALRTTVEALRQVAWHRLAPTLPPLERAMIAHQLRRRMRAELGYDPDLRHPRTFNERVAHRMLHDHDPRIPVTTDKLSARDYVAARLGPELLVPLYGAWDRAADVPWDALPDRFALKASHGWQMNLLVRDKAAVDRARALREADAWLHRSHYEQTGEWGYRDLRPRLLAEALLEGDRGGPPEDFKFYVFGGQPRLLEVHLGRGTADYGFLFFDPHDLRPLPEVGGTWHGAAPYTPPQAARALAPLAARLGADFAFARVDLYLVGGRPWFGELTHYPASGCIRVASVEQDLWLGKLWAEVVDTGATSGGLAGAASSR
jgi:hypothetical protein